MTRRPQQLEDRVTRLERSVTAWHLRVYGHRARVAPTVRHLLEEVGELQEALLKRDRQGALEEAADVALILQNLVRSYCGASLFQAMERKHRLVQLRTADRVHRRGRHRRRKP